MRRVLANEQGEYLRGRTGERGVEPPLAIVEGDAPGAYRMAVHSNATSVAVRASLELLRNA